MNPALGNFVLGSLLSGAVLAGVTYTNTPVIGIKGQIAQECQGEKFQLILWDVDDVASVTINGEKAFQSFWAKQGTRPGELKGLKHGPGNSQWTQISKYIIPGMNTVTLEAYNNAGCCSVALWWQIARGQKIIHEDRFRRKDSSQGVKYSKTVIIDNDNSCNTPIG